MKTISTELVRAMNIYPVVIDDNKCCPIRLNTLYNDTNFKKLEDDEPYIVIPKNTFLKSRFYYSHDGIRIGWWFPESK